jgi:putative lipoprotein
MIAVASLLFADAALADEASVVPPEGKWLAEDINGAGVIDDAQTTLEIGADGQVSGSGGCNRFFGPVTINGGTISFGALGSTRMMCPPAVMDQEQEFFAALAEVRSWRIDDTTGKLALVNEGGTAVLTLSPQN